MDGAAEIKQIMIDLRENPLISIDGSEVIRIEDYQTSVSIDMKTGLKTPIAIPISNVLIYYTADGTQIAARPSGTEPKIKFYFSVHMPLANKESYEIVGTALDAKIDRIVHEMKLN